MQAGAGLWRHRGHPVGAAVNKMFLETQRYADAAREAHMRRLFAGLPWWQPTEEHKRFHQRRREAEERRWLREQLKEEIA